jgi:hypothetical protein
MDAGAFELESSKVAWEGNNHAAGCSLEVSTIHLVDTIIHEMMTFRPSSTVRQKGIIRDFCFGLPDGHPYTRAPK